MLRLIIVCLLDEIGPFLATAAAQPASDPDPQPEAANSTLRLCTLENEFAGGGSCRRITLTRSGLLRLLPARNSTLSSIRSEINALLASAVNLATASPPSYCKIWQQHVRIRYGRRSAPYARKPSWHTASHKVISQQCATGGISCRAGDRADAQIGQLREVIASVSDLIEPLHIGATP